MRHLLKNLVFIFVFYVFSLAACAQTVLPASVTSTITSKAIKTQVPATATLAALGKVSLGYYTGTRESFAALQSYSQYVNLVSVDVYSVTADGKIIGNDEWSAVSFDRAHGIKTYACINNFIKDAAGKDLGTKLAMAVITLHKERLINELIQLAQDKKYDGINIDFERISDGQNIKNDRENLTAFIHELSGKLQSRGLGLIISVPAKSKDDILNSWTYPFDLAALSQYVDYLQVMTYDEYGPWGKSGPVSGIDWVEKTIAYEANLVDPAKLLVGLPDFGYNWSSDGINKAVLWTEVPSLLAKSDVTEHWDQVAQSPWLSYSENDQTHVVWYENVKSIQAKAELVKRYSLGGISVWALGKEDKSFWQAATGD